MSEAAAAKRKPNIRPIRYACGTCGKDKPRDDLLAKRVTFTTLKPVRTVRSRTTGWVCSECRSNDPAWNQPSFRAAPGYSETGFARGE